MGRNEAEGRLLPGGSPKCKEGEESGLFCGSYGAGSGFQVGVTISESA